MSTYRTSCGETLEKLPLYVGGDLDPETLASVRAHLEVCGGCARRARAAQQAREGLVGALRDPGQRAAGPSLWGGIRSTLIAEGLIQSVPQELRAAHVGAARRRSGIQWLAPLAAAAALVAILQGSGLLDRVEPEKVPPGVPLVAAPEAPADSGTLRRIAPSEVEAAVPFQARRQVLGYDDWLPGSPGSPVSTAGLRPR